jgi:hypothetical protein
MQGGENLALAPAPVVLADLGPAIIEALAFLPPSEPV